MLKRNLPQQRQQQQQRRRSSDPRSGSPALLPPDALKKPAFPSGCCGFTQFVCCLPGCARDRESTPACRPRARGRQMKDDTRTRPKLKGSGNGRRHPAVTTSARLSPKLDIKLQFCPPVPDATCPPSATRTDRIDASRLLAPSEADGAERGGLRSAAAGKTNSLYGIWRSRPGHLRGTRHFQWCGGITGNGGFRTAEPYLRGRRNGTIKVKTIDLVPKERRNDTPVGLTPVGQ